MQAFPPPQTRHPLPGSLNDFPSRRDGSFLSRQREEAEPAAFRPSKRAPMSCGAFEAGRGGVGGLPALRPAMFCARWVALTEDPSWASGGRLPGGVFVTCGCSPFPPAALPTTRTGTPSAG